MNNKSFCQNILLIFVSIIQLSKLSSCNSDVDSHYFPFQSSYSSSISNESTTSIKEILHEIELLQKEHITNTLRRRLPFITLTYAQSINGMITAKGNNSKFPISCDETKMLTHGIRSIHDGILVGGNTFVIDNPRLNVRLWSYFKQPRPIVLDTELKGLRKLLMDDKKIFAENVIICCNSTTTKLEKDLTNFTFLYCDSIRRIESPDIMLDLQSVLDKLAQNIYPCIKSIMVEGGSKILSSFLPLSNCVVITLSPQILPKDSLNAFCDIEQVFKLVPIGYWKIGRDIVIVATPK